MISRVLRSIVALLILTSLVACGNLATNTQTQASTAKLAAGVNAQIVVTGSIYSQPVDPSGKLFLSSWRDPDGSDLDQYVWDNFTLLSNETITEIDWYGGYDPLRFGIGGPVLDFTVAIYPSIAAGTEPAVANPPLVTYQTAGNANEASIGTINGTPMYFYSFVLPSSFSASAGVKYWVQIEAFQHGASPDWGLAAGTGGNASHYLRTFGAGGDTMYRTVTGDTAFTLLGPVVVTETPTPTDTPTDTPTATDTPTETPTETPTDTATPTDTPTSTATDTPTLTPTPTLTFTDTPTNTPTDTPTPTPTITDTPTNTPTDTSTFTPTNTATDTPTYTPTPTDTPTSIPTDTPTPTPVVSTPGQVTGGGSIGSNKGGSKATFGFMINFSAGDMEPKGNLTYQDHANNWRIKATSFDMLVIDGNHAWFTGTGMLDDGQLVSFTVEIDALNKSGQSDTFYIYVPALNGYEAGGAVSGGNITIH